MNRPTAALVALALLTPVLPGPLARAQSAPPKTEDQAADAHRSESDRGVSKMSPFVVATEKDTGYIAADTLNAGLLNTKLIMTPGNIDVFTRDFVDDIGAVNIDEASAWLTSSRPLELGAIEGNSMNPGSLAQNDSGVNVSLRGLGANPSTRNYFTSASTPKEYNVERVESSRGPNAILYGEGGPGGGVNYITKRAKSRNFATVRLRFDDNGSKGASLDYNRKLTSNLDARYNLNLVDTRYYIDRTKFTEFDNALNLMYRPFERTNISFDADITHDSRPGLIMTYGEQYSKWDHQAVNGKLSNSAASARGLANWTGGKNLIWVDGQGLMDYTGYAHSAGVGLPQPTEAAYGDAVFPSVAPGAPGISAVPMFARSFNANPDNIQVADKARDFQLAIDHTFLGGLSLQLAGQYSHFTTQGGNYYFTTVYLDPLATLPNGSANPNYGKPFVNSYIGRSVDFERDSKSVRFVAAYPLEILGTTTNISAFLTHQVKNDDTIYTDLHIKDPASTLSITDSSSLIHVNMYLDNLQDKLPDFRHLYDTVDVPTVDGRNHQKIDAFEVALSGSYLHDTLSVIAGFRRDRSELTSENGVVGTRDPVTGAFTDYTTDSRVGFNNTSTYGLVYFPVKYVGVYANHGEGFIIQTISNKRLDGSFAKANIVPAKEQSVGLRFQFGDDHDFKIVGSVGYYRAEQQNAARSVGVGNINTLWRDLGEYDGNDYSDRYIETFVGDPFSTSGANAITSSQSTVGTGWEGSLTANVGRSFRLTMNAALPQTKQTDVAADYVAYVNANFAKWAVLANNPSNPNNSADTTWVNQLTQTLTGFQEGRQQNYTYDYRVNFFGVYTFQDSMFKGLRLGGGVQFYGPAIAGNEIGRPYDYVYAQKYHLVSAQIGYPIKIGKYHADLQLNVSNLFDYDDPIVNGLFVYTLNGNSQNIPYGRKFVWPRLVRLTLTIPF